MPYDNSFQNAITFEMSLTNKIYWRRVYSTLDLGSDIGGLFGLISPISLSIIAVCNYFSSYQFIMSNLFYENQDMPPSNSKVKKGP